LTLPRVAFRMFNVQFLPSPPLGERTGGGAYLVRHWQWLSARSDGR
jgi:hypothetical protein